MAQQILIPLSFELRKRTVKWKPVSAQVVAWRTGPERSRQLIARIGSGEGTDINLALSHFSPSEQKALLASRKRSAGLKDKCDTADLKLEMFSLMTPIPLVDRELKRHTQPADAWMMRDDFLRMKSTPDGALVFLNKWGRWRQMGRYVELRELVSLQRAVREALVVSPDSWFAAGNAFLPAVSATSVDLPQFAMVTDACREAISVATTVDLLRRVKFKVCARGDCALPFKVVSKHSKQYCSQPCAHLESVRRNRKTRAARQKGVPS